MRWKIHFQKVKSARPVRANMHMDDKFMIYLAISARLLASPANSGIPLKSVEPVLPITIWSLRP